MKKILSILFVLIVINNGTLAQNIEPINKHFFTISYFGEKLLHPGLQLSLNHSFYLSKDASNNKNRFDFGFAASSYFHSKNHIGLRLTPNISVIRTNTKGFEYGIKADAGFMKRFYQGKVFGVDENGNVEQKYLAGNNAFTYGVYFVFAKKLQTTKLKNIRIFMELGGFQEAQFNGISLFHPSINVGISKYFK